MLNLNTKVTIHDGIEGKIVGIFPPDKYFNKYRYKISYKTPFLKDSKIKICTKGDLKNDTKN